MRQLLKSSVARSAINKAATMPVTMAASFATAWFLLHTVGPVGYGRVLLISSLLALIPFADLGVGAAVTTASAKERGPELGVVLVAATRVLLVSAGVVVAVAIVLALWPGWNAVLGVHDDAGLATNATCIIVFSLFGLSLPLGLGQRVLQGVGQNPRAVLISTLTPLITLVVTLLLWVSSAPPISWAIAAAVGLVVTNATMLFFALSTTGIAVRWLLRDSLNLSYRTRRNLKNTAAPMVVIMIAIPVALQSDRLVLSHVGTAFEVAQHSLATQLFTPLWALFVTAGQALWPIFIHAREAVDGGRAWLRFELTFMLCAGAAAVGFVALGGLVSRLLSSGSLELNAALLSAFALLLLVQVGQYPVGMYLTRPKELSFQAACAVSMLVLNLGLSIPLAGALGASGPVFASGISVGLCQLLPGAWRILRDDRATVRTTCKRRSRAT